MPPEPPGLLQPARICEGKGLSMKRSPALYGFNELLARTDEELRDILVVQPKPAAGSPAPPTPRRPEEEPLPVRRRLVAVNDDHLFPDAVTPSKVEGRLSLDYDIPFIDDDDFALVDDDYFPSEPEEKPQRLPLLDGMQQAFASDEDLTSICDSDGGITIATSSTGHWHRSPSVLRIRRRRGRLRNFFTGLCGCVRSRGR